MSVEGRKLAALIADHIERSPETYDQRWWGSPGHYGDNSSNRGEVESVLDGAACGSAACVAGWAVRLVAETAALDPTAGVDHVAKEQLGLEESDSFWLFSPHRTDAAMPAVLRHYAETGFIDRSLDPGIPW